MGSWFIFSMLSGHIHSHCFTMTSPEQVKQSCHVLLILSSGECGFPFQLHKRTFPGDLYIFIYILFVIIVLIATISNIGCESVCLFLKRHVWASHPGGISLYYSLFTLNLQAIFWSGEPEINTPSDNNSQNPSLPFTCILKRGESGNAYDFTRL